MRVALLAPPWFPVPPPAYGGVERVVALLADGLVERGHDVTLFASGDSSTRAALVSVFDEAPSHRLGETAAELRHALACLSSASEFDLVHDHSGPLAAALVGTAAAPTLHTVHGPLEGEAGSVYASLASAAPSLALASLSHSQRRPMPALNWVANCPNGIDVGAYPYVREKQPYLAFVGRMSPDKGVCQAIGIARAVGMSLLIAAKLREEQERAYFDTEVRPLLAGDVEYLGELGHDDKVALLGGATATLFPIDWEEPFGLVVVESLACGTPVLATRRGAAPELLEHGRTGLLAEHPDGLARAFDRVTEIEPADCRAAVEARFTATRMVDDYVSAYESLLAPPQPSRQPRRWRRPLPSLAGELGMARGSPVRGR